jgi:hypothetical protein
MYLYREQQTQRITHKKIINKPKGFERTKEVKQGVKRSLCHKEVPLNKEKYFKD